MTVPPPGAAVGPAGSLPLSVLLGTTADAVAAVRAGRSLTHALAQTPADARAGTQALAFHVLRGLGHALVLRQLLVPRAPPPWPDALLLTALALLAPATAAAVGAPAYAAHTVVSQAVDAAKRHAKAHAAFVNAVLRRCLRDQQPLLDAAARDPLARWNHPPWWIDRLRQDWPDRWSALLAANDLRAPMHLRVNARRTRIEAYVRRLADAGLDARIVHLPQAAAVRAIELAAPCPVQRLPGFADGEVSVQDLSAQQAAPLLLAGGLPPGARVLDACAAPGGKSAHLLELADVDLLALDVNAARLQTLRGGLERLGLHAQVQPGDAADPTAWWDGRHFDAILLDAPCSASGIVRRHPDVRWLRRPSDIASLARAQATLLDALWPLLRPGGRLVYATCSVFRAEGGAQIDSFLQRAPDGCLRPSPGHVLPLPDNAAGGASGADLAQGDGFFYAALEKRGR